MSPCIINEQSLEIQEISRLMGGATLISAALRKLHKDVTAVRVLTEWGNYEEMLLKRCRSTYHGRGMRFFLRLEQIIRVGIVMREVTVREIKDGE